MSESTKERQRNFAANQARLGLVQVRVWVHKSDKTDVLQCAARCNEARGVPYKQRQKAVK